MIIDEWVKQVATSYLSLSLYSFFSFIVDHHLALLHMRKIWPSKTGTKQDCVEFSLTVLSSTTDFFWMWKWSVSNIIMPINQVQNLQKQLAQLKEEAKVNRIPVSEAVKE